MLATFDGTPSAGVVVSNGGLTVTHGTTNSGTGVFSTAALWSGKYYFEVASQVSTSLSTAVGIRQYVTGVYSDAATFANGVGVVLGASSLIYANAVNTTKNLGSNALGDTYCFAVDLAARLAWVRRNGGNWNADAAANPVTGVNGVAIPAGAMAPVVKFTNTGATDAFVGNFGQSAFSFTVPSGFNNWPAGLSGATGPTGAAGSGTTPGGADTQVQYNNAGAFGGSANLTWNNGTSVMTLTGQLLVNLGNATSILAAGTVEAGSFKCTGTIAALAPGTAGNVVLRPNGIANATGQLQIISTGAVVVNGTLELGHATDTTLSRVSAGVVAIEGQNILTAATGQPLDADLTAIAALTGTNTIYYRSGTSAWTAVTIGTGLSFTSGTLAETRQYADNTGLSDDSGNELLWFQKQASAVNHLEVENAATTTAPILRATGTDTNVGMQFDVKGSPDAFPALGSPVAYLFNMGAASYSYLMLRGTSASDGGPSLSFFHDTASPAANDYPGAFDFTGRDTAANIKSYASIWGHIIDPTAGSIDGDLEFYAAVANTGSPARLRIGDGVQVGVPTGGYKGHGSINATAYYKNGVQVGGREVLTAARNYYVATTGLDSNDGLAVGTPFLTIQKAIDVAAGLDTGIYNVTINVADGTYSTVGTALTLKTITGAGVVSIVGNATTPTNCIISVTSGFVSTLPLCAGNGVSTAFISRR